MPGSSEAVISGLGLVSSLGHGLAQSCASVRARINRFKECEFYVCQGGPPDFDEEPLIGAVAPAIEPGSDRIGTLALAVIRDLARNARLRRADFMEAGFYLSLPPAGRPGSGPRHSAATLADMLGLGPEGHASPPAVIEEGNTGCFTAVQAALAAIRDGKRRRCVVVGVDSWFDEGSLGWLDAARRLKCGANANGLIPGEAAAAVLLESLPDAARREAPALAVVGAVGSGREAGAVSSGQVSSGIGLAEAVGAAALGGGADGGGFSWVACDLNGEPYRASEWGFCQMKLGAMFRPLRHLWHPADCLGDVGAATGAALMALVSRAFERGYARADRCLLWASADGGQRSALVLSKSR